ncbi:hypothetical protein DM992_27900 [Burkholderia sp. JP2-270]|nr:hypothetical protein DM992_27900 [Burkholderia sp. JP2-270]
MRIEVISGAIVTYVMPCSPDLHYHGISIKPANYLPDQEELAREHRERNMLSCISFSYTSPSVLV